MKRWRGWEPATVYEHDEQGRLVRSVPETEWDDEQRGWVLALAEYRATRCPCGCGNDVRETTAMEGTHVWRTSRVRCHARSTLVEAQQAAGKDKNGMPPEGVMWSVSKAG